MSPESAALAHCALAPLLSASVSGAESAGKASSNIAYLKVFIALTETTLSVKCTISEGNGQLQPGDHQFRRGNDPFQAGNHPY